MHHIFRLFQRKLRAVDLHQGMKVALGCGSIATVERVEVMDGASGDTAHIRGAAAIRVHFRDHPQIIAHPRDVIDRYSKAAALLEMVNGPGPALLEVRNCKSQA